MNVVAMEPARDGEYGSTTGSTLADSGYGITARRAKTLTPQGIRGAPPARLERATYGLEVRRSIRLSYGGSADGFYPTGRAGDGSRTRVTSLEGWGSTIELHPLTPP
jgi:hypothetical protein